MDLKELTVETYTTPSVLVVDETETVAIASDIMEEQGVRHLPIARGQRIVGLVCERDLRPFLHNELRYSLTLSEIAKEEIYSVHNKTPLMDVVFHMSEAKIDSAIVIDEHGKLSGIFTTTDALNALVEIIRGDIDDYEAEEEEESSLYS